MNQTRFQSKFSLIIPFGIGGMILLFMFLTFFDFFEPYLYPLHMAQGKARSVTPQCIVGSYPREAELVHLKSKCGIINIVSLFDETLPQEKALLMQEKKLCDKYHLHLLRYPLSYVSLDSAANQKRIDSLLAYIEQHPKEKFYIHCYLGKHRAGKVETLLRAKATLKVKSELK